MDITTFTLFNIWLSIGLFPCSDRSFIPKSNYHVTTLVFPMYNMMSAINQHQTQLITLYQHLDAIQPNGLNLTLDIQDWQDTIRLLQHHMDVITAVMELDTLQTADNPYQSGHSIQPRNKRALVPFWGRTLKFLWGTATTEDLDDLVARIKQTLAVSTDALSNLDGIVRLSNKKMSALSNQVLYTARSIHRVNRALSQFSNITDYTLSLHQKSIQDLISIEVLKSIEEFFLSIHELIMIPNGFLCGQPLIKLLTLFHDHPKSYLSQDMINTAEIMMFSMDTYQIIIQISHYTSEEGQKELHLKTFDQIKVGIHSSGFALDFPVNNLVLNDMRVLGHLETSCVDKSHHFWQMSHCPLLPYTQTQMQCLQEIISNETATSCTLMITKRSLPLQRTCTNEYIFDPSQITCDDVESPSHALTMFSSNDSTTCYLDKLVFILPATQPVNATKIITPMLFLFNHLNQKHSLPSYHMHATAYELEKLSLELMQQTENWTRIDNVTSDELRTYLNKFSKDRQDAATFLSSLMFKTYTSTMMSTLWAILEPILLSFCVGSSLFFWFMYLCIRKAHATSRVLTPQEISHENAIIVADWILISIIITYCGYKIVRKMNNWRYVHYPKEALLVADKVPVVPGQLMIFVTLRLDHPVHGVMFLRYLIAGVYHHEVVLVDESDFGKWNLVTYPPLWRRLSWNWKLRITHTGCFKMQGHVLPKPGSLWITFPNLIHVDKSTDVSISALTTSYDLFSEV